MEIINSDSCIDWLAQRKVGVRPYGYLKNPSFNEPHATFRFPTDEHWRTAQFIAERVSIGDQFPGGLLWITDWGMWVAPVSKNLIYAIRSTVGEKSLLIEKAGHIFGAGEGTMFECLLAVCIAVQWDVSYVPSHGKFIVTFEHDGLCVLTVPDPAVMWPEYAEFMVMFGQNAAR